MRTATGFNKVIHEVRVSNLVTDLSRTLRLWQVIEKEMGDNGIGWEFLFKALYKTEAVSPEELHEPSRVLKAYMVGMKEYYQHLKKPERDDD